MDNFQKRAQFMKIEDSSLKNQADGHPIPNKMIPILHFQSQFQVFKFFRPQSYNQILLSSLQIIYFVNVVQYKIEFPARA